MDNPLSTYVKNGVINISEERLKRLKQLYSNKQLMDYFGSLNLRFPYKSYYIEKEMSLHDRLELGKKHEITIDNKNIYKNNDIKNIPKNNTIDIKYLYIRNAIDNIKLYEYHVISDIFTESCRVKCKVKNNKSIYEYFKNKTLQSKWLNFDDLTYINMKILRDRLYYSLSKIELNTFPAIVALTIYRQFKATMILDMSSGWGDRLLAAITYEDNIKYYYGVDPNKCLFPGYKKIIKLAKDKNKFIMINDCFENTNINKKFDMMFSSPPYFDFEKYIGKNQSYKKYKKLNDWLNNFMYISIKKIYDLLIDGGYFCLNISDTGNVPYVYDILNYRF